MPDVDEFWARLRRENELRRKPLPECRDCGAPFMKGDRDWLFRGPLCCSCGAARLEAIIRRLVKRRGRRKTIKVLRALARAK
jgi:hypothetical protein